MFKKLTPKGLEQSKVNWHNARYFVLAFKRFYNYYESLYQIYVQFLVNISKIEKKKSFDIVLSLGHFLYQNLATF